MGIKAADEGSRAQMSRPSVDGVSVASVFYRVGYSASPTPDLPTYAARVKSIAMVAHGSLDHINKKSSSSSLS
jgi:hypothetical protein